MNNNSTNFCHTSHILNIFNVRNDIIETFLSSLADEINTFLIQFTETEQSITNPRLMSLDTEIIPHSRQEETNYFLFVEIYLECLLTPESRPPPMWWQRFV